jgi:predicted metal-dependent peptidase
VLRMASEVKYIKDVYNPEKLTIAQFDTRITREFVLTEDDIFEEMMVYGRGGTDLACVRQHMLDNQPTAAIIFSDMYCDPMEPGPTCPIVWIVVNNPAAEVPFGKKIHMRE